VSPVEPKYEVYFIDFGNKEKLPSERVRTIDAALSAVPPQARPAGLAYLKVRKTRSLRFWLLTHNL
jgi:staphylococcal nuclease domain-containing protein 1